MEARKPARWLLQQISLTLECYIFRNDDRWLRCTATNSIDPGPHFYTSTTNCIPHSTLDAGLPSMVNAAHSIVEISHPVTDPSSLVEMSSCSLVKPFFRSLMEHYKHLKSLCKHTVCLSTC